MLKIFILFSVGQKKGGSWAQLVEINHQSLTFEGHGTSPRFLSMPSLLIAASYNVANHVAISVRAVNKQTWGYSVLDMLHMLMSPSFRGYLCQLSVILSLWSCLSWVCS